MEYTAVRFCCRALIIINLKRSLVAHCVGLAVIMAKYLVIANTYGHAYGCELTLFGIFDTQEEALKWILEHPKVCLYASESDEEDQYEEWFDFFEDYDEELGGMKNYSRRSMWGNPVIPMTKEEYILGRKHYIHRFNGEPLYLGGYCE